MVSLYSMHLPQCIYWKPITTNDNFWQIIIGRRSLNLVAMIVSIVDSCICHFPYVSDRDLNLIRFDRRVHISEKTMSFLNGEFEVEDGDGASREEAIRLASIKTYLIVRVIKPVSHTMFCFLRAVNPFVDNFQFLFIALIKCCETTFKIDSNTFIQYIYIESILLFWGFKCHRMPRC